MSFILDALKKSERNRRQGHVPDVMTVHSHSPREPKKHLLWLYLFLGAMLINAGILAAFLRPWDSKRGVSPVQTAVAERDVESVPDRPPAREKHVAGRPQQPAPETPAAKEAPPAPAGHKGTAAADAHVMVKAVNQETGGVKQSRADGGDKTAVLDLNPSAAELEMLREKIRQDRLPETETPLPELQPAEDTGAGQENGVTDISQLPGGLRKELPEISIKGHIYSNDPSSRIVNINGVMMREGDTLTKGLKLEEITISGVIFNYRGRRFSIRAF